MSFTASGFTAGLQGLSTVLGAFGQFQQGRAESQAQEFNAAVSRQQAVQARIQGNFDKRRAAKEAARLEGKSVALLGVAGVGFTGSPLAVLLDNAMEAELDQQILEFNTQVNVNAFMSEAALAENRAGQASSAGLFNAGSTLLTALPGFMAKIKTKNQDTDRADFGIPDQTFSQSRIIGRDTQRYRSFVRGVI